MGCSVKSASTPLPKLVGLPQELEHSLFYSLLAKVKLEKGSVCQSAMYPDWRCWADLQHSGVVAHLYNDIKTSEKHMHIIMGSEAIGAFPQRSPQIQSSEEPALRSKKHGGEKKRKAGDEKMLVIMQQSFLPKSQYINPHELFEMTEPRFWQNARRYTSARCSVSITLAAAFKLIIPEIFHLSDSYIDRYQTYHPDTYR